MVYFRIEMGLGKDPKENKCSTTVARRLNGMSFAKAEAERIDKEQRHKTAYNYLTAVRSLTQFIGNDKWSFADITTTMLERYQRWLCNRGLRLNTVSVYMRTLRALYNRAVEDNGDSPFSAVFTGHEQTAKRSVTDSEIRQLLALRLDNQSHLALARDLFVFSFMAMGMPFVDIAHLKWHQIHDGVMHYARHKTGHKVCVNVEPCMAEIIKRHTIPGSEYVFPLLADSTADNIHHTYLKRLRSYNYALRRLSLLIDSRRKLSSYVARHSWASLAYRSGLDISQIAKAMGHTKLSTTLIYIRALFDPSLAEANRKMMQSLGVM